MLEAAALPFVPDEDAAQLSIKSGGELLGDGARDRAPRARAAAAAARRLGGGRLARLQRALDEMTRRRDERACEVRKLRHELDKAKGRHDRYAELKEASRGAPGGLFIFTSVARGVRAHPREAARFIEVAQGDGASPTTTRRRSRTTATSAS